MLRLGAQRACCARHDTQKFGNTLNRGKLDWFLDDGCEWIWDEKAQKGCLTKARPLIIRCVARWRVLRCGGQWARAAKAQLLQNQA